MIRFSALLPISAPFECVLLISAPILISAPYSNIITAPSEYVSNVVYLPVIADICNNVLQKQWSSSECLNCNVHVST